MENTQFCICRLISLLQIISKVIETITDTQLYSYLKTQHLLHDNQYGFRMEHSTEFAALALTFRIKT